MTDDAFEYVESVSGAAGGLAKTMQGCHAINDSLTKVYDHFLGGPDNTDAFDPSCNTCKHFQRHKFDRNKEPIAIFGFPGHCLKLDKKTTGWPRGQYDGFNNADCYENRRTGLRPHEVPLLSSKETP